MCYRVEIDLRGGLLHVVLYFVVTYHEEILTYFLKDYLLLHLVLEMSVISRIKSKRFSGAPIPTVQSENSVSDLKKIYSEFTRKMSFANRSRSQTFDLAEIQGIIMYQQNIAHHLDRIHLHPNPHFHIQS